MQVSESELEKECGVRIARGSKSFAFASRLFGPIERRGAFLLYAWCRAADDAIDQAASQAPEDRLRELRARTAECFQGGATLSPNPSVSPGDRFPYLGLAWVARTFSVPPLYASDLLDGMETDVLLDAGRFVFDTPETLRLYCYRVAGAVGILMSHVMGVSDLSALDHAAELGIAMQLTNISRDVFEDARNGRVYLPLNWLETEGLSSRASEILAPENRAKVHRVVVRLLGAAEESYRLGERGLQYLPFRAALAVGVASAVYRRIGRKILAEPRRWQQGDRMITSKSEKILSALSGLGLALRSVFSRKPGAWQRVALQSQGRPLWTFPGKSLLQEKIP